MRPARDVALVLIRHAKRQPIQFDATGLREMKNVFVAIVEKSRRIDRLEMAERRAAFVCQPALPSGLRSRPGGALRGLR